MNIDIRQNIVDNFKEVSIDELEDSIVDAIDGNEEITLPGSGVLFEILWNNSNKKDKEVILNNIYNGIKKMN